MAGGEQVWGMREKRQGGAVGHPPRGPATALPTKEFSLHPGPGLQPRESCPKVAAVGPKLFPCSTWQVSVMMGHVLGEGSGPREPPSLNTADGHTESASHPHPQEIDTVSHHRFHAPSRIPFVVPEGGARGKVRRSIYGQRVVSLPQTGCTPKKGRPSAGLSPDSEGVCAEGLGRKQDAVVTCFSL